MAALYSTLTEIAMIRISTGSGTILLPGTSTITGRQVSFKDYLGTLTSNSTVTFSTQSGDYFEDGTTSKTYSNAYAYATFYTGSTTRWNIIGGNALQTMNVSSMQANSLQVNSLTIGTGTGWLGLNPIQTLAVSTIQTNTSTLYANTEFLGSASTLTAIQFYGVTGSYSNTVLAEQSTGTGIQEFVVFRGSSASDRIRMQTTGSIVFEPGVSARTFTGAAALATPTMTMLSNLVGIGTTGTPGALLDVAGTGRFQLTSTLGLNVSSINNAAYPPASALPSSLIVSTITAAVSIEPIIQNPGQGFNWTKVASSSSLAYSDISVNQDTTYLACVYGGFIYYYNGTTTTQQGTSQNWSGIYSGGSGTGYACVYGGKIYKTTDYGTTWTIQSNSPTANWTSIRSYRYTQTSINLYAASSDQGIWYSVDAGTTWVVVTGSTGLAWSAITGDDANTMFAVVNGGQLYKWTGGGSVSLVSGSPTGAWNSVAASYIIGQTVANNGYSMVSMGRTDGNVNYVYREATSTFTALSIGGYVTITNSMTLMAVAKPGSPILLSYDQGATFQTTNSGSRQWSCIDVNVSYYSGGNMVAAGSTDFIYQSLKTPVLNILGDLIVNSPNSIILGAGNIYGTTTNNTDYVSGFSQNGVFITLKTPVLNLPRNVNMLVPKVTETYLRQPFIQYGKVTTTAGTPYTVTMPYAYSGTTYVVQITYVSTTTTTSYAVSNLTSTTFSISWTGGTTAVDFNWTSFGT